MAIVGTGQIGRQSHLPAALACPDVVVTALVDRETARTQQIAREYGIRPKIAADVRSVLGDIDAAIVATPNHTHREIAVACLEAGVSVLIEKPLAHTAADGQAIVEAAHRSGAALAVGYCLRFRDNVQLLKELLDAGQFGRVLRFAHRAGTAGGWAPFSGYNLDRASTGGGVLVVTGSHFIDRMLFLWGYPSRVGFLDDSHGGPEANCRAVFGFERDGHAFEGCAIYSKTAPMPAMLVIETDRGLVVAGDSDDADIVFRPHGEKRIEQVLRRRGSRAPQDDVFRLQIEDFVDAHRRRRPPLVDGAQGLMSMRLIEALYAVRQPLPEDWYGDATGGRSA